MKKYLLLLCFFSSLFAEAQEFDDYFIDQTLRIDYIFAGNANEQFILIDELPQIPLWAGRRKNLSHLPLEGNGKIEMKSLKTGEIIYCTSFSTLFHEWLITEEARFLNRSFQNTFLLPYPKDSVEIKVVLYTNRREVMTQTEHLVAPEDILIRKKGENNVPSYTYLHKGGAISDKINVVILPEGYQQQEMGRFYEDARLACESLFAHAPMDEMKDYFNVIAVEIYSKDSGVSIPGKGIWKDTPFGSHFDTFYSARYLTTNQVKTIHNQIAGVPYEHIIILANTDNYGGGGIYNAFTLTTAHHENFGMVVVHEFGHSFAGLGDEYFYDKDAFSEIYPIDVEPWEPNITTLVDFQSKWSDLLPDSVPIPTDPSDKSVDQVGVYEGAGYSSENIYRGAIDCRMRTNRANSFCPVCQDAIRKMIEFYTN